jgi:glucose/arabinose dehydrogenase
MKRIARGALVVMALCTEAAAAPPPVTLQPLPFQLPGVTEITHAGDASGRLFLAQKAGRIRVVRDGQLLPTPFLDISSLVVASGEQGLLGLAFDPFYRETGHFYIFYNRPLVPAAPGSEIVIARYTRSGSNPDVADPASALTILTIPHPGFTNHNGGKLAFSRDNLLHIGVGDGGGGGDPFDAANDPNDLRGKILRIDLFNPSGGRLYGAPFGNPFASNGLGRPEVYHSGLRNPWRFSFDRGSYDLLIADVGQNSYEEVNRVPAMQFGGLDFGWSRWEGNHCFPPASTSCATTPSMAFPVIEYGRAEGASVVGGHVYRGWRFPELRGQYVFGDFVSGHIWAAESSSATTWAKAVVANHPNLSTFGESEGGEIHAADFVNGTLVRLAPQDADGDGMSDAFEAQHFGSATGGDPALDSDGDGAPNLAEYQAGLDPAVRDNDIFTVNRLFAQQQYRDFLGREGDEAGVTSWTRMLDASWARRSIARLFLDSPEFQAIVAPAARLYLAYFLRGPDAEGLRYWVSQLRAGQPLAAASNFFAASAEFQGRYGALSDTGFVDLVYQNVLGRAGDPAGRSFWISQLGAGMTRGELMLGFSESGEFRASVAGEVFVSMVYIGLLQRGPDPAGFDYWVGYLDRPGMPQESMIEEFLQSPEYRARFLP